MGIALVADASCDIPQSMITEYGITILPVTVLTDQQAMQDTRDAATTLDYYRDHLVDLGKKVTTQPVTAEEGLKIIEDQCLNHADYVIVQTTGRHRSKTYDNMNEAAARLNQKLKSSGALKVIRVMDTRALFAGMGVVVAHTQALINKGLEGSEVRRLTNLVADQVHTFVVPSDLRFIRERARQRGEDSINFVSAFMGKALGITPVVCGHRERNFPCAKFKGFSTAVEATLAHALRQVDAGQLASPYIAVSYSGDLQDLNAYQGIAELRARHERKQIRLLISTMGLAGATYLGPGSFSLGIACAENAWSKPN